MRTARISFGLVFCIIGLAAVIRFDELSTYFLFLSPDRHVEPFMMLLLRICLVSLGSVGVVMLLRRYSLKVLTMTDDFINRLSRRDFFVMSFLAGLALRSSVLILMPFRLWADYASYDDLGWQWATMGGYYNGDHLTAYWPPAYPFFLSRLYLLLGHQPFIAAITNIFWGLSIAFLTYMIARRIWDERVSRWALVIMILFPSQILFTRLLASEMLFTPLLLAALWVFMSLHSTLRGRPYYALLGGVLLGLASLTRSISLPILLLIIVFWVIEVRSIKIVIRYALPSIMGVALVVAPWMIRNHYAVGSTAINTNTGINLYIGNQPASGMGYNQYVVSEFDVNDPTREAYIDSVTWHRAWEYILDNPVSFLRRGVMKVGFLYAGDVDALDYPLIDVASQGGGLQYLLLAFWAESYYLLVLLGAFLALLPVCFRRLRAVCPGEWLLAGTIAYWTALHFLFYGMGRYHFPIIPFMAAFAALYIKNDIEGQPKTG